MYETNNATHDTKMETELSHLQAHARAAAVHHLMVFWPREAIPRRGRDGVLRHGFGRAVERSPQPVEVSRMALEMDLQHVSSALEARTFALFVAHPDCADKLALLNDKLALLYSIADIVGVEQVRDMDEVWTAANLGKWNTVAKHLGVLHWSAVDKDQLDRRMAAMDLVFKLGDLH